MNPALLSLIGTIAASGINAGSTMYGNRVSRQLADEQYRRQKADIREQNAYNSPAAQVLRLKAAGINPAMAFQNGITASAGEQSAIPSYDRAEYSAPTVDASSIVGSFTDVARLGNETGLNAATIKKINKETDKIAQQFEFDEKNNPTLLAKAKQELENARQEYRKYSAEIEEIYSRAGVNEAEVKRMCLQNKIDYGNFVMSILKFPHEIWSMDVNTLSNWMNAHTNQENVQLGWAMLRESKRHNRAQEYLGGYNAGVSMWKTVKDYKISRNTAMVDAQIKAGNFVKDLMYHGEELNSISFIQAVASKL